eukprot:scaffold97933_cov19-Tisochrysis_lutea.AAC.1
MQALCHSSSLLLFLSYTRVRTFLPVCLAGAIAGLFTAFVVYKWRNRDHIGFTDAVSGGLMPVFCAAMLGSMMVQINFM